MWVTALAYVISSAVSLGVRAVVPPQIFVDAGYDEQLFTRTALHLSRGEWLGPFDGTVTLAKGMGYPAFLAAAHLLHVPFLMAQQLLHLAAAAAMAWGLHRLTRSHALAAASYAVIALDPGYLGTVASRPLRDNFYASVSLLLVALMVVAATRPQAEPRSPRVAMLRRLLLGGALGLAFSGYWLTREERPWLIPTLLILAVPALVRAARRLRGTGSRALAGLVVAPAAFVLVATSCIGSVMIENDRVYGVALTNDTTEGAFATAFGRWQTVRSGPMEPYVPITRGMREAVFAVSPAAREIQPFLSGTYEASWVAPGCGAVHVCNDVAGGWTQWMLRTALAHTGRYATAPAVQRYWHRLDHEITQACADGRLRCRRLTPFLLPQPDTVSVSRVTDSFMGGAKWVVEFRAADKIPLVTQGSEGNWQLFTTTLGGLPAAMSTEVARETHYQRGSQPAEVLAGVYRLFSFPLVCLGAVGFLWALLRRRHGTVVLAGAALLVGVVGRIGVLALVDATAFPATQTVYEMPAYDLLIAFALLGLWLVTTSTRRALPAEGVAVPTELAASSVPALQGSSATELTVLLPCLNEALTLKTCIDKARRSLDDLGISYEILVADNGSTDGSQDIARAAGARVVDIPTRGYGAALRGGIAVAEGEHVLMADADDSYALDALEPFVTSLRQGNDLVMGNRFRGGIEPGAMPALHRYLGNPVLSWIGRMFFRIPVRDFHCGIRAFNRRKALALGLRSDGMEFASELVVKFALNGHRVAEVPTTLKPDGRDRPPHLRSWRDGWRHLRFLLLFSPRWLFLYPGLTLAVLGSLLVMRLSLGPVAIGSAVLDTQSLVFASAAVTIGVQSILFAVLTRTYAASRGMLPASRRLDLVRHPFVLERGLIAGGALLVLGGLGTLSAILTWTRHHFGPLVVNHAMHLAVPSVTLLCVGAELLMASFFLGLLQLDHDISGPLASPEAPGALAVTSETRSIP
jgi:hypothetical protein